MSVPTCLRSLAAACALGALALLGGCVDYMSAPPTIVSNVGPSAYDSVPEALRTPEVQILYVTDRLRQDTDVRPVWYGYGRDTRLSYGLATVHFGRGLTWDDLVAQTSGATKHAPLAMSVGEVRELGRFPSTVPRFKEVDGKLVEYEEVISERERLLAEFQATLSAKLALTPKKDVWVFIHGYNNPFQWPLYIWAQVWHYMGREGVPIVYTWPAGAPGLLRGYTHDRESGEFTNIHLKNFLRAVALNPDVQHLHVVAHSRGTDVAITAMRELHIMFKAQGKSTAEELKLRNFVLCAPDLDAEVSTQRLAAERMQDSAERFTMYVSSGDKAINAADWLFGSKQRFGKLRYDELPAQTKLNLEIIKRVSFVDVTLTTYGNGHSYFYEHPQVLSDFILMLRDNKDPGADNGRPLVRKSAGWWELDKDYLPPEKK